MLLPDAGLTIELVPHCESVPRAGWTESHDVRPLAARGYLQAEALASALGAGDALDAIYSSPARRCRQTVDPLAKHVGLPVDDMAALYEAGDFSEPAAATEGESDLMVTAIGGAWAAGRMLSAVRAMMTAHPGGRVVAASHGDVIPVVLAVLSTSYGIPRPAHTGRGGWYTLCFSPGALAVTSHAPVMLAS